MTSPEDAEDAVARCQALIVRALTEDHGHRVVEEFVGQLDRLPADHPHRGRLAGALVMVLEQHRDADMATDYLRHLADLLAVADTGPPPTTRWERVRAAAGPKATLYAGMIGQSLDPDAITDQVAALTSAFGDNPRFAKLTELTTGLLHGMTEGNLSALSEASATLPALLDEVLGDAPEVGAIKEQFAAMSDMFLANQRNDPASVQSALSRLTEVTGTLPEGHIMRAGIADSVRQASTLWQLVNGEGERLTEERIAELAASAARPDAPAADRVMAYLTLAGAFHSEGVGSDPDRIDQGVACARSALELTTSGEPLHNFCLFSVAVGLYLRSEAAGTTEGLDEAVTLLEAALKELGGPEHPHWTQVNDLLANVRLRSGEQRVSGEVGLVAQRGYAWRVLRESDTRSAREAVRDAAESAISVARQCLGVSEVTAALRALDTGRGLMLFAATELPRFPAMLRAAGHDDLADRWEADGAAGSSVRRKALGVLAELPGADLMFDPPSLAEIRTALGSLDADALVYLVPADPPQPGLAVIAPADGPPAWLPLPALTLTGDVEVERYLSALVDRSRDLAPPAPLTPLTDSLDALCDWAWRVAVGPLLERYFPVGEREPRIVLVPMGDLARIPWAAARRADGRYAIELAEFSYAVSARLLCENAAWSPVATSATGLIVGDPDTAGAASDLVGARTEAHALRRGFYQGARYVGRRPNGSVSPSGAGTSAQVRQWLTDTGPAAGGLLHLACHGRYEAERAHLLLAPETEGGPASTVSAEEIVALLAEADRRRIGLAVLAACHTGRSVYGYDEAYSLGTALLAGRVRSVLSTQWSIPDRETSALMYMFHHYRVEERLPVRRSLLLAQRWLLDSDRRAPAGMPAALLASVPRREPAPVYAWAGFVHYGQ
ncbi:hypothetical protein BLA60_21575 [Actinophytocola xinjiangensis]|uniref:CHAT domain-containing protein n=1 Tax=Actinophytocola xinjiangensis TaxID=485602 RepID=A0A7Z1AWR8_9PSEU|nr:CHAT domain-containing protein [Actinophytocola xinjiangensis]OLF09164.1 hypothetical protein BLA60_21575 [Actinophytocola xinjiangensis]